MNAFYHHIPDGADAYLSLLRRAVFPDRSQGLSLDTCHLPLDRILRLCHIHGTGPLIYNELLKDPALHLELSTVNSMKQTCMQNMLLQSQWEQLIARTWAALGGEVHAVLMKGFSYARLYPLSYLRSWGDLDVWVGPEQYHRACGILREAFPEAKHHDEEWDELKHYCFVFPNGMAIELHRVSMDFLSARDQAYWCQLEKEAARCSQHLALSTQHSALSTLEVPIFSPEFDLLFCFMHSWEHFCGTGIPLKQVCDMALLLEQLHMGSDPVCAQRDSTRGLTPTCSYLLKHLKALHMLDVWRSYGYMVCRTMGLPLESWPLGVDQKYGERLYQQVMAEGQCRKKDYGEAANRYEARDRARQMNIVARKWLTLRGRIEKAQFMYHFAPRYACYTLWQEIKKGIRRTIRREQMINY